MAHTFNFDELHPKNIVEGDHFFWSVRNALHEGHWFFHGCLDLMLQSKTPTPQSISDVRI